MAGCTPGLTEDQLTLQVLQEAVGSGGSSESQRLIVQPGGLRPPGPVLTGSGAA